MKKLYLVTLLSVFILGTIIAMLPSVPLIPSVPSVKAHEDETGVKFYIWNATSSNNIYSSRAVGLTRVVEIWVDSPISWDNTANGIVTWALSIRVDPTRLEVMTATSLGANGFLGDFLVEYGYDSDYLTTFAVAPRDAACKGAGVIKDIFEGIQGFDALGVGAGGGPTKLCTFTVKSKSTTNPSPLIITGRQPGAALEATASYQTPDATWHYVDIQDMGWYISSNYGDKYFFDSTNTWPPIVGSTWNQLWSGHSNTLTVTAYTDTNSDTKFNATDVLTMRNETSLESRDYEVMHVTTMNSQNDGVQDLIALKKPGAVPEFPLGVELIMLVAPAVVIVYIWRLRKNKPKLLTTQTNPKGLKP
jgi:hypothetical protein